MKRLTAIFLSMLLLSVVFATAHSEVSYAKIRSHSSYHTDSHSSYYSPSYKSSGYSYYKTKKKKSIFSKLGSFVGGVIIAGIIFIVIVIIVLIVLFFVIRRFIRRRLRH
ncbi:hypothetical protein MK805_02675 [Shimazuella sp. AN120528]|uniref:hypothetical protein n=1 Tax=Shimazuella soli TaxID=1892854 RepID=UPI001F0F265C|nr:hypothetical protein [Shimazuella soli]MCH5583872.1 hypothetical protein [Shimazuella soli]